ncbi:MAG: hypothetical protein Q9226_003817 [Calogaya cf. arnoldii]
MKYNALGFVALLSLGLHAHAASVRVDVASDGEIAVDVDMKPETGSRTERGHSDRPVHPSTKAAHDLAEYTVDLDYEIHGGTVSESGKFLKFKNIPYAQPPVGHLRFSVPYPINPNDNKTVNYGWNDNVCSQAQVGWAPKAMEFMSDFSNTSALADWKDPITEADYGPIQVPAKNGLLFTTHFKARINVAKPVSEDCLTLDVMVPKTVWDRRHDRPANKYQYGSPEGLFDAATAPEKENIIYVAMNYRLGAFGWLGGKKYRDDGGVSNLGLLDQAFATNWVRNNIHLFGGDARRQPDDAMNDVQYTEFLKLTEAENFNALRTADTKVLQNANAIMVHESKYGYFNFGPTIDGSYVLDLPGKILGEVGSDFPVPAMLVGHTKFDGLLFTPPWIRTTKALTAHVRGLFPNVPRSVLIKIAWNYRVPVLRGPQAAILAAADFFDDIAIQCNSHYLTEASLKVTSGERHPVYRYVFNALPAIHGYDTGYTLLKADYSHALGHDLMDLDICEYWRPAPYSPPPSEESNNQRFLVQEGAEDDNMQELK